jgi:hypothetical protein
MTKFLQALCLSLSLFAFAAAADQMTGYISDSKCGAAHTDGSEKSVACVKACVKGGLAPVFVTEDKKVLKIDDKSKVADFLGKKVEVTGSVEDDTLKIDTIKAAD